MSIWKENQTSFFHRPRTGMWDIPKAYFSPCIVSKQNELVPLCEYKQIINICYFQTLSRGKHFKIQS